MSEKIKLFVADYINEHGQYCHQEHLIMGYRGARDYEVIGGLLTGYAEMDCKLVQVGELLHGHSYKEIEAMYKAGNEREALTHMRVVFIDSSEIQKINAS